jgi:hypothetical protein
MLNERRGVPTAKYLINTPKASDGCTHLYERGRLDLTVEALVVENAKWHELFTDEELKKGALSPRAIWIPAQGPLVDPWRRCRVGTFVDRAGSLTSR